MKSLKLALVAIFSSMIILVPAAAHAEDISGKLCSGANFDSPTASANCDTNPNGSTLESIAIGVVNIFSWIIGVVAVIMIIYGGFKYITSSGNDSAVTSAKNTILYAIVGLVIVALAQVIVRFVISKFSQQG